MTRQKINDFKNELLKLFPAVEAVHLDNSDIIQGTVSDEGLNKDKFDYQTFCLYLGKTKKVFLRFSQEYLEQNSLEEFSQHLQRNIYFITQSNINKTIYLLKNFEIEIEDASYA